MNRERLTVLMDYLLQLPEMTAGKDCPQKFDMDFWYVERAPDEGWCGTAACALGHACYIPEFQEAGLHLKKHRNSSFPVFGNRATYEAGAAFFNISGMEAGYLFDPNSYDDGESISPACVASRIHELLNPPQDAS